MCIEEEELLTDDLKLYGKTEKELDRLVYSARVFHNDIKMEFRIAKSGVFRVFQIAVRSGESDSLLSVERGEITNFARGVTRWWEPEEERF